MRVPFDRAKKGGESDPRNRLIHKIFSLVGLGERAGSGIFKITQAWNKKVWKEPEITELFNPDRTILRLEMKKKKNVIENVVENVIENLNKQQKSILDIIIKDPKVTQKQIAEQMGITVRQVARILKQLKEKNVIERIGSDRRGYWKISINNQ